ncbi:hypothetical protein AX17_006125 [Amanita inopinata Kibby_2008]|nr:hypothetical protein AX17_006125 [Amanita inopinata Kibby_2008]
MATTSLQYSSHPFLYAEYEEYRWMNRTTPLVSSQPPSQTSPPPMSGDESRHQDPLRDVLDSTTLEVGFDPTCLQGLTQELLYSPFDAFAESCWATVSPDFEDPPLYDPPSYTVAAPTIYNLSQESGSQSTIRSPRQQSDRGDEHESSCFWDDDGDDDDDDKDASGGEDERTEEFSPLNHGDVIKKYTVIDTEFAVSGFDILCSH